MEKGQGLSCCVLLSSGACCLTLRVQLVFLAILTFREQVSGLSSLEGLSFSFVAQGLKHSFVVITLLGVFPIQRQPLFLPALAVALSPQAKAGGWMGRLWSRRAACTSSSGESKHPGAGRWGLQWRPRSLVNTSAEE